MAPKKRKAVEQQVPREEDSKKHDVEIKPGGEQEAVEVPMKEEESKKDDVEMKAAGEEEAVATSEVAREEPEGPKELEEDAPEEKCEKIKAEDVAFHAEDTTLNVIPIADSSLLMSLSDGGMQYLLAGARASVGVKAGRYMFEAAIAEIRTPSEPQGSRAQPPRPKQLMRVGFSAVASCPILTDRSDSAYFDSEGFFSSGSVRRRVAQKIVPGMMVAIVLNLDPKSQNVDTVSLFCNGTRVSEPQALPDQLKGKALYPAVTYRNMTVHVNLGPQPLKSLPFKCNMVKTAARKDCEVKQRHVPKDGMYDVVVPVCLPDEGTFEWVDQFLIEHKHFAELSERTIADWALKSGIHRPVGQHQYNYGLPFMDDHSVSRTLASVAPTLDRNLIVVDVKANLLADERKKVNSRFVGFKKVAHVMMGEPSAAFKKAVHEAMLQQKKAVADAKAKRRKAEAARNSAEQQRRRKILEARNAKDAEETCEEKQTEEAEKEPDPMEEQEEGIAVELTEEEKKQCFLTRASPDIAMDDLARHFGSFGLPAKEEGFDEVKFGWAQEDGCRRYLAQWVLGQKLTQRVETIQPGEWFRRQWCAWAKLLGEWKRKQQEFKDPAKRKAAAKRKREEEKNASENGHEQEAEEAAVPAEVDAESLDVLAVEDVADIGNGEPLFANFAPEDWALLSLRFELHLLVHGFRHDLDDPECASFVDSHLAFYYNRYFKKQLLAKNFACMTFAELLELIKDTVETSSKNKTLACLLAEDTPMASFVKMTEDHRRDRQRRLDAGDETAELKFPSAPLHAPQQPHRLPPGPAPPKRPPFAQGLVAAPPAKRRALAGAGGGYGSMGNGFVGQRR